MKEYQIELLTNYQSFGSYILQIDKVSGKILNKFGSAREAARYLGNESKNVSINYCLRGKQKTAYGYIWKYENN